LNPVAIAAAREAPGPRMSAPRTKPRTTVSLELEDRLRRIAASGLVGNRLPETGDFALENADPFLELIDREGIENHADLVSAHRFGSIVVHGILPSLTSALARHGGETILRGMTLPQDMLAVALDGAGGPDVLVPRREPLPALKSGEV